MKNQQTENRYTGYLKYFYDYNEHECGKGIKDEVTMCNFISFLRENRFSDGSLWCVYTALNKHYKQVTKGGRLQDLMLLQTIMRNTTKTYVSKKSETFTAGQLKLLLHQQGLDEDNTFHLESKVGGILAIYGLLRVSELLKLSIDDVSKDLYLFRSQNKDDWEVKFPYKSKTRK